MKHYNEIVSPEPLPDVLLCVGGVGGDVGDVGLCELAPLQHALLELPSRPALLQLGHLS